jgi:hypothetical protein
VQALRNEPSRSDFSGLSFEANDQHILAQKKASHGKGFHGDATGPLVPE